MRYEILRLGPVVVVLLFIAGAFLWFWLDERRFAAQVDRRFAPYKTQPKEREEPKPLKAYLDWVDWREMTDKWMELQEDIHRTTSRLFQTMGQRVTALEEEMGTDDPTRWTLRDRIVGLEQQIGVLQGAATPSRPTASPTTDRSWAVAEQDYTPRLSPASWPSDQQIMDAGPVARVYESAEE